MATNNHRCREWLGALQNPGYHTELAQEGVRHVAFGQYQDSIVVALDFTTKDAIKEFLLDRKAYSQEQVVQMYVDAGKNPQEAFQSTQSQQQTFFFQMG